MQTRTGSIIIKIKGLAYIFTSLLVADACAGAWGVGSFENDGALDWGYDLMASRSSLALRVAFRAVPNHGDIPADSCSAALAAVEVVAALKNKNTSALPPEVASWVTNHYAVYNDTLLEKALTAINACENKERSSLAQLWLESAPKEWKAYLMVLKIKLK